MPSNDQHAHISVHGPRYAQLGAATGPAVVSSTAGGYVSVTVTDPDGTTATVYASPELAQRLAGELTDAVVALRHALVLAAAGVEVCGRCRINPPTAGDGRCWPCHTLDAIAAGR